MNNNPKISIITVVYNGEQFLEKTILSIVNQTYSNMEYIVIDGNSSDGTVEIIKKYEDKIDYWVSESDNGIYDAMNKGIKVASEDSYLIFLNAGDVFVENDLLLKVKKEILYKDPLIIYGGVNIHDEENHFIAYLKPLDLTKENLNKFSTRVVCHQSIFVHKSIIKKYDLSYRLKAELNWYYDLLKDIEQEDVVCDVVCIDIPIVNYMLGGTGDKHFWENYIERLKVTYEQNTIFIFFITMPFFIIPFIFRLRRILFGK